MDVRRIRAVLATCLVISGCGVPAADPAPQTAASPQLVGKMWLATDASAAAGTLRIFLADGTLLMDSCGETYRLARWRATGERRIEWQEDTARIEAEITEVTSDRLSLRLHLVDGFKEEAYRSAEVPYVCPDMPR